MRAADRGRDALFEQSAHPRGRGRLAKIITLSKAAAARLKKSRLLGGFHTFRDEIKVETFAEADHGGDDGGRVRIGQHVLHE